MEWLEIARVVTPLVVEAVEKALPYFGHSGQAKQAAAVHILDTLLPGAPPAAAPNREATAQALYAPIVDEAVQAMNSHNPPTTAAFHSPN